MEEPTLDELIEQTRLVYCEDKILPIYEIVGKRNVKLERFSTGFQKLDKVMNNGFKDGDLVIISGISGEGKTTLAQTLTFNLTKNGIGCLWFSYEVSIEHLDNKFKEMGMLDHYNAYSPEKNTTGQLDWIKAKIREGWIKYATKVVFIDHIDFLTPTNLKTSDNQSIAYKNITTELKSLAIELNVTIVLMAHCKKNLNGKEPEMEDIGYSGGIFQLADYVLIVFREKLPRTEELSGNLSSNKSIIKLVKNRETGQRIYIVTQYNNGKLLELTEKYDPNEYYSYGVPKF